MDLEQYRKSKGYSYKKLAEIFQKADIEDDLEYLLEPSKKYPKGKIQSTLRNVLQKLPEDQIDEDQLNESISQAWD